MTDLEVPEATTWALYAGFIETLLIKAGNSAQEAKKLVQERHPAARAHLNALLQLPVNLPPWLNQPRPTMTTPNLVEPSSNRVVYSTAADLTNLRDHLCEVLKALSTQKADRWIVGKNVVPALQALGLPYKAGSDDNLLLGAPFTEVPGDYVVGISGDERGIVLLLRPTPKRVELIDELMDMSPDQQRAEIRQLLLDIMDITEQGPVEQAVIAAFNAFEAASNDTPS